MSPSASKVFAALLILGAAAPAHATRVPMLDGSCDLSTVGVLSVSGMTINSAGEFVVLDDLSEAVHFLDRTCGVAQASFDIAAFGAENATGIAWDSLNSVYAIVDFTDDELYFTTAAGLPAGSCDLSAIGSTSAKGIAYDEAGIRYAIVDDSADEVFLVDDSEIGGGPCGLISQFDTAGFGSAGPSDITYMAATGQFAVIDSGDDEVYYLSSAGVLVDQFDTAARGGITPLGGVYDPVTDRFFIAQDGTPAQRLTLDVRGTSSQLCLTSTFGATTPTGLGQNSVTGALLVTDSVTDQIYVLDAGTCAVLQQYGLAGYGVTLPEDVAYVPLTGELVVVDSVEDSLFFFDEVTGALTSSCSTVAHGYSNPTGVEYLPELDLLAVTSDSDDSWLLVDTSCNVIHARSVGVLDNTLSGNIPEGITYHPGTGRMLVLDAGANETFVSNFEGNPVLTWDLDGLGITEPTGLSIDLNNPTWTYVLSNGLDAIYRVTVPALIEHNTLSGRFTSALGTTFFLWERGEGRVTGTMLKGGNLMPLFGQFVEPTDTLYFGIQNGNKLNSGTMPVSADRSQIFAPAAIGTLLRDY